MFISHFIASNIFISLLMIILYFLKSLFNKRLSPKWHFYSWIPLLLTMICVFLPKINMPYISTRIFSTVKNNETAMNTTISSVKFADDLQIINYNKLYMILFIIWLLGIIINICIYFISYIKINNIIKKSDYLYSIDNCNIFITRGNISPFSFGFFKKAIILPYYVIDTFDIKDIENIIQHEITHYKHKDNIFNILLCVLNILFWFNPFTYYIFNKIRLDMEIFCDYDVIRQQNYTYVDYGSTLINFAANRKNGFKISNNIISTKKQLQIRLNKIVSNCTYYNKNIQFLFIVCIIIVSSFSLFFINVFGYDITNNVFGNKDIEYIDIEEYFDNFDGCFVMYNENDDKYVVFNKDLAKERYSPYSTYKIAIALNGFENNIISEDNSYMKWNGVNYPFATWNKNQNLSTAFKDSVNWYFQNIDRNTNYIGKKIFLNNINYGNKNIGLSQENYWLDGSLKISVAEQVEFLSNVFGKSNKYNFKYSSAVKDLIKVSDGLYGKTGSGTDEGWFVGILERNENNYFFALHISGENSNGTNALNICKKIFKILN